MDTKTAVAIIICIIATVAAVLYDKKVVKPVKKEHEDAKRNSK